MIQEATTALKIPQTLCQIHRERTVLSVCLDTDCEYHGLFCYQCIKYHYQHIDKTYEIKELLNLIADSLNDLSFNLLPTTPAPTLKDIFKTRFDTLTTNKQNLHKQKDAVIQAITRYVDVAIETADAKINAVQTKHPASKDAHCIEELTSYQDKFFDLVNLQSEELFDLLNYFSRYVAKEDDKLEIVPSLPPSTVSGESRSASIMHIENELDATSQNLRNSELVLAKLAGILEHLPPDDRNTHSKISKITPNTSNNTTSTSTTTATVTTTTTSSAANSTNNNNNNNSSSNSNQTNPTRKQANNASNTTQQPSTSSFGQSSQQTFSSNSTTNNSSNSNNGNNNNNNSSHTMFNSHSSRNITNSNNNINNKINTNANNSYSNNTTTSSSTTLTATTGIPTTSSSNNSTSSNINNNTYSENYSQPQIHTRSHRQGLPPQAQTQQVVASQFSTTSTANTSYANDNSLSSKHNIINNSSSLPFNNLTNSLAITSNNTNNTNVRSVAKTTPLTMKESQSKQETKSSVSQKYHHNHSHLESSAGSALTASSEQSFLQKFQQKMSEQQHSTKTTGMEQVSNVLSQQSDLSVNYSSSTSNSLLATNTQPTEELTSAYPPLIPVSLESILNSQQVNHNSIPSSSQSMQSMQLQQQQQYKLVPQMKPQYHQEMPQQNQLQMPMQSQQPPLTQQNFPSSGQSRKGGKHSHIQTTQRVGLRSVQHFCDALEVAYNDAWCISFRATRECSLSGLSHLPIYVYQSTVSASLESASLLVSMWEGNGLFTKRLYEQTMILKKNTKEISPDETTLSNVVETLNFNTLFKLRKNCEYTILFRNRTPEQQPELQNHTQLYILYGDDNSDEVTEQHDCEGGKYINFLPTNTMHFTSTFPDSKLLSIDNDSIDNPTLTDYFIPSFNLIPTAQDQFHFKPQNISNPNSNLNNNNGYQYTQPTSYNEGSPKRDGYEQIHHHLSGQSGSYFPSYNTGQNTIVSTSSSSNNGQRGFKDFMNNFKSGTGFNSNSNPSHSSSNNGSNQMPMMSGMPSSAMISNENDFGKFNSNNSGSGNPSNKRKFHASTSGQQQQQQQQPVVSSSYSQNYSIYGTNVGNPQQPGNGYSFPAYDKNAGIPGYMPQKKLKQ